MQEIDEQIAEQYLQFRVPTASRTQFPNSYSVDEKYFVVDPALPLAAPIGPRMRPPCEQIVHEHWKLSIQQTPADRKGHANAIEKVENSPGSFQRFLKLRKTSLSLGKDITSAFFEPGKMPLCFFPKEVSVDTAIEKYAHWCRSFTFLDEETLRCTEEQLPNGGTGEIRENCHRLYVVTALCENEQSLKLGLFVEGKYGWIVNISEPLQCYANSPCTLLFLVPPGCRVSEICSPFSHLVVQKMIPIRPFSGETLPTPCRNPTLTSLGINPLVTPVGSTPQDPFEQEVAVSQTLTWTQDYRGDSIEDRQMPVYRRASDMASTGATVLASAETHKKELRTDEHPGNDNSIVAQQSIEKPAVCAPVYKASPPGIVMPRDGAVEMPPQLPSQAPSGGSDSNSAPPPNLLTMPGSGALADGAQDGSEKPQNDGSKALSARVLSRLTSQEENCEDDEPKLNLEATVHIGVQSDIKTSDVFPKNQDIANCSSKECKYKI